MTTEELLMNFEERMQIIHQLFENNKTLHEVSNTQIKLIQNTLSELGQRVTDLEEKQKERSSCCCGENQ